MLYTRCRDFIRPCRSGRPEVYVMRFETRDHHAAVGKHGMVAAAHPLAVLAGIDALRRGGNAMDACIVMAGVTSVVLPHMCGLGGDAFFVYYDASSGKVWALNGSGAPGDLSTPEYFIQKDSEMRKNRRDGILQERHMPGRDAPVFILPQDGILSVAVPGAPLVYERALKRFGTFTLKEAFEPAAELAEKGFPVTRSFSRAISAEREKLEKYPPTREIFLPGGKTPVPGEMFVQSDLARTLREFSQGGAEYFYKGPFADRFYALNRELDGTFTGGEFARYLDEPEPFYTPISTTYRGYTIYETRPVSQGFIVLEELNILEEFDLPSQDPESSEVIHIMVEAKERAFRDRNLYAGDPAFSGFDVRFFISKERSRQLADTIKSQGACRDSGHPVGGYSEGDTTSFVAVDRYGNACSFIHSNAFSFGSGLVVPGTGVILNNRAGRSFVLEKGHPNCVAPGKRPMHTLNCYMVFKGENLFVAGGTPGGDGQPQWNMQMLSLMLDFGAGPQDACDFPRWLSFPGTDVINIDRPPELRMESRFGQDTIDGLRKRGHTVKTVGPWAGGGGAQIIMVDPDSGLLLGGSDRRVEGLALGF